MIKKPKIERTLLMRPNAGALNAILRSEYKHHGIDKALLLADNVVPDLTAKMVHPHSTGEEYLCSVCSATCSLEGCEYKL